MVLQLSLFTFFWFGSGFWDVSCCFLENINLSSFHLFFFSQELYLLIYFGAVCKWCIQRECDVTQFCIASKKKHIM